MVDRAKNLLGQRFDFLTVIAREGNTGTKSPKALWRCRCACGAEVVRQSQSLRNNNRPRPKSCGCQHGKAVSAGRSDGHMMTGQRPWRIWMLMKQRCRNPRHKDYVNYGARGIDMPDHWYDSFNAFWAEMKIGYADHLTIERKDVNLPYSKQNCRWATWAEQSVNKRDTIYVDSPWGQITLKEASVRSGIAYGTLYKRMERGRSVSEMFAPVGCLSTI